MLSVIHRFGNAAMNARPLPDEKRGKPSGSSGVVPGAATIAQRRVARVRGSVVCTALGAPASRTRAPSRQAGWTVTVQRCLVARVRATYKSLSPPGRAVVISSGFMTTTLSNSRPRASDAGTMRA